MKCEQSIWYRTSLSVTLTLFLMACGGPQASNNAEEVRSTSAQNTTIKDQRPFCVPGGAPFLDSDLAPTICPKVFFASDSAKLDSNALETLRLQAAWLDRYLKNSHSLRMILRGYCDPRGNREHNIALGRRRARAVKKYFVAAGIGQSHIKVVSFCGQTSNGHGKTDEDFAKDRRVESQVIYEKSDLILQRPAHTTP